MFTNQTHVRVRYAETDQMGVVYYANYLVWMEVARVDYCKAIGFRYRDMELQDGIVLAVVESHCRYLSPARFDDEVIIETHVPESSARMIRFAYEMRIDSRKIARGETKHIYLARDGLKPVRLPGKYRGMWQDR